MEIGCVFSWNSLLSNQELAAALWVTSPCSGNCSVLSALGGVSLPDIAHLSVFPFSLLISLNSVLYLSLSTDQFNMPV